MLSTHDFPNIISRERPILRRNPVRGVHSDLIEQCSGQDTPTYQKFFYRIQSRLHGVGTLRKGETLDRMEMMAMEQKVAQLSSAIKGGSQTPSKAEIIGTTAKSGRMEETRKAFEPLFQKKMNFTETFELFSLIDSEVGFIFLPLALGLKSLVAAHYTVSIVAELR
ncbi:hypothetical protein RND71_014609 [Anisodus tanguticus]|uniref:Uncharacterized protein n=1 Tax=Anisodus tanguticus TaxID=243964 RepID=A0AAE1VMW8_9SOLA|nr:hypothetical protein RND71_014609 [Anisodus tanguticus]